MAALEAKVALVTGASRGIGAAISIALARQGADVALNYHRREDAARTVSSEIEKLGRKAKLFPADVSQSAAVERMIETIQQDLGPVNILVNNAGIARPQKVREISEADWDQIIAVNLKSTFLVTQAVLPSMEAAQWGRIINISSVAAQTGGVVGPHYAASKAGMLGLTHSYSALLAKSGITVNAIAPALIETEMVSSNVRARTELIPVGRFGTVEEVAEVAVLLAMNGYITGQTVHVNGGWYMS
ncbi:MAG: 3-oxoacyl-ACP reductase FabG [Acidobacteria bacterium]|nr:3-oxoacyl-ACP reductase FabG [Acidobacteriota bacterium]